MSSSLRKSQSQSKTAQHHKDMNLEMDHDGSEALTLRRQRTLELDDGHNKGNPTRSSSRASAVKSVNSVTISLSKKYSTSSSKQKDVSLKSKRLSSKNESIEKRNKTTESNRTVSQMLMTKSNGSVSQTSVTKGNRSVSQMSVTKSNRSLCQTSMTKANRSDSQTSMTKSNRSDSQTSMTKGSRSISQTSMTKKKSGTSNDELTSDSSSKPSPSKQSSTSSSMAAKDVLISRLSRQNTSNSHNNGVELWYRKGSFVATRAPAEDEEKYYICVVLKDIHNFTKKTKVRWLDKTTSRPLQPRRYKMKYSDFINPACILLEVVMKQVSRLFYEMQSEQHCEIVELIKIVEDFEKGNLVVNDIDDDVHEVIQVDEPPKKRAKLTKAVAKKTGTAKRPAKKDSAARKPAKKPAKLVKTVSQKLAEKAKKTREKKEKAEKKAKKTKDKKEPKRKVATSNDLVLNPRPDIKVMEKDPLFETNEPMPYISKEANCRLIFRAIFMEDAKLLRKLLKDKSKIYMLLTKSVESDFSPLDAAVKTQNVEIFRILLDEFCGDKFDDRRKNNSSENIFWDKLDTGQYNPKSLGIRRILKLQASRGSKEGNNAFLKRERGVYCCNISDVLRVMDKKLDENVDEIPDELLKEMQKFEKEPLEDKFYSSHGGSRKFFIDSLLKGRNKIAGKVSTGFVHWRFSPLMKQVLTLETEDLSRCPPSAVKFTSKTLDKISPFHIAAVNPNPKYLERLLSVEPLVHRTDSNGRRPIHLAACCSSTANLELLLKWGANMNETCHLRETPLHYAIKAGRPENVKFLLQKATENSNGDISYEKFGPAGILRPMRTDLSPLHTAVKLEYTEIIKTLLTYGAAVNAKTSVSTMQMTPLMMAAITGNLNIVKLLVENGAVVEQKDRLGRTALIHACRNGATNVLSYLVHLGSNPERPDTSDNYPIHYAAAYGWYFTLRFLISFGVDINVLNMWKFSPISVAFLKGHVGIVRELLMNDKVDINQTMEDGSSLLFQACASDLSQDDLFDQIEYLIKEKGALCDIRDVNGKTALFYAARAVTGDKERILEAEKQSIKIANLLIENGCDITAVDVDGCTAAMEAIGNLCNLALAETLLKKGCKILGPPKVEPEETPKESLLHTMVRHLYWNESKAMEAIQLIRNYKYESKLREMACHVDKDGYTPLLYACIHSNSGNLYELRPQDFINPQAEKSWDALVPFFRHVITNYNSDVNAKVAEKFMTLKEKMSVTHDSHKYSNVNHAGKTALHLLLKENPQFEMKGTKKETRASFIISHLVEKGTDLDYLDIQGMTPFGDAVTKNFMSTAAYLKEQGKCNVNLPLKIQRYKPDSIEELPHLHYENEFSHSHDLQTIQTFSTLIDHGIDVNAKSNLEGNNHGTFLHLLLQRDLNCRPDLAIIVDKLIATSFDFDGQDDKGRTVMHYAFRSNTSELNDSLELECKLMKQCSLTIEDSKQMTPLHHIFKKKGQITQPMINFASRRVDGKTRDPAQLLQVACKKVNKKLLSKQDYRGRTVLHLAAEQGCCHSIYLLTKNRSQKGVDINLKDKDGNTPLTLAIQNGHDSCAFSLIQCGASLKNEVMTVSPEELSRRKTERKRKGKLQEKSKDDEDGSSDEEETDTPKEVWTLKSLRNIKKDDPVSKMPLFKEAVKLELTQTVLQIMDTPEEESGITHKDMIWMAMENGKFNIVLQMMNACSSDSKTANILIQSYEKGRNLLHLLPLSCSETPDGGYRGMIQIAKLLMSIGIPSNSLDMYGCTPIQYAILNRHFELADCLAENGPGYDVKIKDKFGRGHLAALMWRIESSGIDYLAMDFLEKLINLKLNLNTLIDLPVYCDLANSQLPGRHKKLVPDYWQSYPESKTTALICAIICSQFDDNVSHNLLAWGASPNFPDGNNISPLMHAVMQNKNDFVRQLLHYEYDPNEVEPPKDQETQKIKKVNTSIFRLKAVDYDESSDESEVDDEEEKKKKKLEEKKRAEEYKPVKKTSSVQLDQKDNHGRTALHYVSSPSPLGTLDNAELAFILIKGGAKLLTDKFGFTPLTLAAETCATSVIDMLKELGHGSNRSIKIQYNDTFSVTDGMFHTKPDFLKDADKILQRLDSGMDVDEVYVHEVDDNCNVVDGKLMKDKEIDVWFDVLMTKVDVKRFDWGLYNFYKMQLVFQPDKKLYILFTRWGRIGDLGLGQFQHTPFPDEAKAIKEFDKIFRAKSGHQWKEIKNYVRHPKKYRLLEDMARKAPPKQEEVQLNLKSKAPVILPHHLYSLIKTLMNPKVMELSMKNSNFVNTASLPFGQLNKERLMQGKQLLEKIQKCLEKTHEYKQMSRRKENLDTQEYLKNCEMIAEMSNDYFHVIPQKNFSCEQCAPLNSYTIIQHFYFISNMLNYEIVSKMLIAATTHYFINPVDFVYRCLGCKIELMQQDDPMSQLIIRYVADSSDKNVVGIYKLSRDGEEERLKVTNLGNHRLLWHGTNATNLLSILTRGMLVAPPEATQSAWMHGKGMYFADEFCKSAYYVTGEQHRSFMLLCQVALGNCVKYEGEDDDDDDDDDGDDGKKMDKSRDKKTRNSTVVYDRYSKKLDWLVLNSGVRIPIQRFDKDQSSYYNQREYIVENPAQTCLRYLVEYR